MNLTTYEWVRFKTKVRTADGKIGVFVGYPQAERWRFIFTKDEDQTCYERTFKPDGSNTLNESAIVAVGTIFLPEIGDAVLVYGSVHSADGQPSTWHCSGRMKILREEYRNEQNWHYQVQEGSNSRILYVHRRQIARAT